MKVTDRTAIHLTSVHPRYDTRIFFKECIALYQEGYCVALVVADGLGDTQTDGVDIWDVGKPSGRLSRVLHTTQQILKKALALNGDIYHLHDPELIPIGLKLRRLGKEVIFDIHENIALQIKDKPYLPSWSKVPLSRIYVTYERYALKKLSGVILAEDSYTEYYDGINPNQEIVLNLPDIEALQAYRVCSRNTHTIFYIGGISNERGLDVTIEALKLLKVRIPDIYMHYVGNVYDDILEKLDLQGIEKNICFHGHLPLYEGMKLSKEASVGLSILKPIENYMRSYSTKVFEYMAIGLPVVTSNFPLYRNVVEKYGCGSCVNPEDPKEIAEIIYDILTHPKKIEQMGMRGIEAAEKKFNWQCEKKKLIALYEKVLG